MTSVQLIIAIRHINKYKCEIILRTEKSIYLVNSSDKYKIYMIYIYIYMANIRIYHALFSEHIYQFMYAGTLMMSPVFMLSI